MGEFVDLGLLYMFNVTVMAPLGLMVTLYVDDEDGQTVLGWLVAPLSDVVDVLPTESEARARVVAFREFIEQEQIT